MAHINRLDEAAKCYLKAIAINPDASNAYKGLADVLTRQGKFEEALNNYNKSLKFDSYQADVWNKKGIILSHMKSFKNAVKCLRRSLKLKPDKEVKDLLDRLVFEQKEQRKRSKTKG